MKYIKLFESIGHALFNAIRFLNTKGIKTLLDAGTDVNQQNVSGRTPLINVVCVANGSQSKKIKIIRLLIKYGADLNIQDNDGYTALIKAADHDIYDVMYELIENDADWNIKTGSKYLSGDFDFIDHFNIDDKDKMIKKLKEKYPDKYKEYLMKKDADKYNL